jgi:BlaI family penicillinase repressor
MSVIWARGSATVAEIKNEISGRNAYVTILTVVPTLESKRHVRHIREGKAHRYFARTARLEAGRDALLLIRRKMYFGSTEMLVASLLDADCAAPSDLDLLIHSLTKRLNGAE